MSKHKLYLCEKPDQGRIVAEALGGGQKTDGGITGPNWAVTWGFGHLLTPYKPEDYDKEMKKWSWEVLPIVPEKFLFKPVDGIRSKQISKIAKLMKGAGEVVISTDPDREGELIAYAILNRLNWSGVTTRLWISDLTTPGVQKALNTMKDASETKPLYWSAMARTYADWIVGMNMSRAATLKLAAYGAKPMSVGRVQTPVLGMIVNLERKIKNFKPEDYFEIVADIATTNGSVRMRHAPSQEKRIKDRAQAEILRQKAEGSKGPVSVKTDAKKQAPPPLFDLSKLQQECNKKFSWSADKTLKVIQALYETHQFLTYPRTDCSVLPEDHKANIPSITANLATIPDLKHLTPKIQPPIERSTVYNDKKVTAHHAIIPTNKTPNMSDLSTDEAKLFLLVCKHWIAAHMPDMEYLQTTITFDANGVPFRASGRQIINPGWKDALSPAGGAQETEGDDDTTADKNAEEDQNLPPLKNGEPGTAHNTRLDSKKTKPPSRFTESSLLRAMENIAAHVEDPAAKKTLKATSGIGTPATRSNVIETLKKRDYIKVNKKQLNPTETAFTLIDAMAKVAPAYADPAMTARWEDVLEEIAKGDNKVKAFVNGIAGAVRKDVVSIKDADIKRMETPAGTKSKFSGKGSVKPNAEWKKALQEGTPLKVEFDKKDKAKELGARWDGERKTWIAPKGKDLGPFKKAGML
jgi:DNA topoisomerase-3